MPDGKANGNGEGPGREQGWYHHYHYFGINVDGKAFGSCLTLSVECAAEFEGC